METTALVLFVIVALLVAQSVKVVPQQNASVVERLGRYHATLTARLNSLMPFIDRVAYKHSLKQIPLDVPSQVCITRDDTQPAAIGEPGGSRRCSARWPHARWTPSRNSPGKTTP